MAKRFVCWHPELSVWPNHKTPEPCEVIGCCAQNYSCPVCGFGAGSYPHDNCEGWDEDRTE